MKIETEYKNPEWPKHEEIYDICMKNANKAKTLSAQTLWIHLSDAVEKGTISPTEFHNIFKLGRVSSQLKIRESKYSNLLKDL